MSTVSSQIEADHIGKELIEKRLAACVNIIPGVTSYYRWGGNAQLGRELILMIKTCKDNFDAVRDVIKSHHSYELPEIIAIPVLMGDADYLKWIDDCSCGGLTSEAGSKQK
jgi:periplasmic divalent cation tolerance protein